MVKIKNIRLEGKVGEDIPVTFKGKSKGKFNLVIKPTCGCTVGEQMKEVNGKFTFDVQLKARKYPQKVEKTVNVYVMRDNITVATLKPTFTIDVQ